MEFITEHLNEKHPTIKFMIKWFQILINFLDEYGFTYGWKSYYRFICKTYRQPAIHISTLHVAQPTSLQQQEIPYNPGSFARICSDPNSFDRRCNDLEKLLIERGYSEREAQKQILRARGFSRDSLVLCWIKEINQPARVEQNKMKITFNLTYYAVFQNVKKILAELATSFAYP